MRIRATVDEDVYDLLKLYSIGKGITLGAAIGELVRKSHAAAQSQSATTLKRLPNGLLVVPRRGRTITSEMVRAALEED